MDMIVTSSSIKSPGLMSGRGNLFYAIKGSDFVHVIWWEEIWKKKIDKLILLNSNRPTGYTVLRQKNTVQKRVNLIFDLGSF